jgi:cytoskeletal protein CcmA (bactofilin family)
MRKTTSLSRRLGALLLVATLVLAAVPLAASAQGTDGEPFGGTVIVAEGETVDGLEAVAGTVIVRGTVDGNLAATAGSVLITGTVTGDAEVVGGSLTLEGAVDGDLRAATGAMVLREGSRVGGTLEAAAGSVLLEGAVGGDVTVAGEEVRIGPTAAIGGSVEYEAGTFVADDGATVGGTVTEVDNVNIAIVPFDGVPGDFRIPSGSIFPPGTFAVYGLLVNALLGVILLAVAPAFAGRVTDLGTTRAVRSGGVGLLAFVAVPVALVALAITIIGIPLSLVGAVLFALTLWAAQIYGALILGTAALSLAERENRWVALGVGLLTLLALSFVPLGLGELVRFLLLVLGLGAFVLALRGESGRGDQAPGSSEEQPRERQPMV